MQHSAQQYLDKLSSVLQSIVNGVEQCVALECCTRLHNRVPHTAHHSYTRLLMLSVSHSNVECVALECSIASSATHCSTRLTIECNTLLNNHSVQQYLDKLSSVLHSSVALDCTIECKFQCNTQHNRVQHSAQHSSATQCSTSTIECTIVEQCVALE